MVKSRSISEWVSTSCAVCPGRLARPLLRFPDPRAPGGWGRVVQCEGCGLRRLDPRPAAESLGRYYSGDYNAFAGRRRSPARQAVWDWLRDSGGGASRSSGWQKICRPWTEPLARWLFDIHLPLDGPTPPAVVEVGCGFGDLLLYLQSRGCRVQGLEPSEEAAARGREMGVPIAVGTATSGDLPDGEFDAAVFCHSLEHVPDPAANLRCAARWLKPGGRLHLAVPNGKAAGLQVEGAAWAHLSFPLHFWFFDPANLTRLVEQAGFELEEDPVTTSRHHYWQRAGSEILLRDPLEAMGRLARQLWASRAPMSGDVLRIIARRKG